MIALRFIHLTCAIGLTAALLITAPLWMSSRDFPLVPLLEAGSFSPAGYAVPYLPLLIGFAWLGLMRWIAAVASLSFVMLGLLSIIEDYNRVHPWFYLYLMVFSLLSMAYTELQRGRDGEDLLRSGLRVLCAGVYFWSGIYKLNDDFAHTLLPWLASPFGIIDPPPHWGWVLGSIEALLGAALLLRRSAFVAASGLLLMHWCILYVIGPLGHNYNQSVWPWNVVMQIFLLSAVRKPVGVCDLLRKVVSKPILLGTAFLSCVVPSLLLFVPWDPYLAWGMYSGKEGRMWVALAPEELHVLPALAQEVATIFPEDAVARISVSSWSIKSMNTPPNSSTYTLTSIGESLCQRYSMSAPSMRLIISPLEPLLMFGERQVLHFSCGSLSVQVLSDLP